MSCDQDQKFINFSNKIQKATLDNDNIMKFVLECTSMRDSIYGINAFEKLIIQCNNQKLQPIFLDKDQITIIKSCQSLGALGFLHQNSELFFKNSLKEKEFRENIRNQIDELSQNEQLEDAFYIKLIQNCKKIEEYQDITNKVKLIINVLINYGNDSFHFTQIFDIVINTLLLLGNNRSIGKDQMLLLILDNLQRLLEDQKSAYLWTIILEAVIQASTQREKPQDLIQPNLIARIILAKIPFMDDLFNYFGNYLSKCYKFESTMIENLLLYGASQQALELIFKLSQNFEKEYKTDLLEQIRVMLLPYLIRYMKNLENFDTIQNLIIFYIIGPCEFLEEKQYDNQNIEELFKNYDKMFDQYSEKQLKRIFHLNLLLQLYKNYKLQIYQFQSRINVEQKLKKKYFQNNKNPEEIIKLENCYFWYNENSPIKEKVNTIVGLKNLLNTCYLNSFLQVLYWTQDFKNLILNQFTRENVKFLEKSTLKISFQKCFTYLDSMTEEIDYTPLQLKKSLREPYRTDIRQQDAGEFGSHLFEDMERSFTKEEYNQIKTLFYGVSKSKFICRNCNQTLDGPEEEFIQLTLNFEENRRSEDIEKMIERHQSRELIQYNCEKCKTSSNSVRQINLTKLSNNLILQINRFQFNKGIRSKINDKVQIKSQIKILENGILQEFELYAIIIHYGPIPDAGHYIACCRVNDIWHRFDDSIIKKLDKDFEKVQRYFKNEETPYLLFYKKLIRNKK